MITTKLNQLQEFPRRFVEMLCSRGQNYIMCGHCGFDLWPLATKYWTMWKFVMWDVELSYCGYKAKTIFGQMKTASRTLTFDLGSSKFNLIIFEALWTPRHDFTRHHVQYGQMDISKTTCLWCCCSKNKTNNFILVWRCWTNSRHRVSERRRGGGRQRPGVFSDKSHWSALSASDLKWASSDHISLPASWTGVWSLRWCQ